MAEDDDEKSPMFTNADAIDGNLSQYILDSAGHEQPHREDHSFPEVADDLKVDPMDCITRPPILVQNGRAWLADDEENKMSYSDVLMKWFKDKGVLETGTNKVLSGLGAFFMSITVVGIYYVAKSMHIVENKFFGAARTKSGRVVVYPPGYRGNFSLNRVDFQKCEFDQQYVNYNDSLHILRVLPGEVAVVRVDGSDMILGPGPSGEVGYHVIISPNVELKQEQVEANRLQHLQCGLWHMVHVRRGKVQHINIDGVDYALFHKPGGHWLKHRKFELGEVYDTTASFNAGTLYRLIVPSGVVAGFDIDGKSRIVTQPCSAWLTTERPVTIEPPAPYNTMTEYTCKDLTLIRLRETERAVVASSGDPKGHKFELRHGLHILRLPARLVAKIDVAPHDFRKVDENLYDQNNVLVNIDWQGRWWVENTDSFTRWSQDPSTSFEKVENIMHDLAMAMARCIQITDLYNSIDGDDEIDGGKPKGAEEPTDRVRRICATKTKDVVQEHVERLEQHGIVLTSVWIRSVTPCDGNTRSEFMRVAEQRANDYAVRRREEQARRMKEVRIASAEREAEERRLELERTANAEKRADDIYRNTEEHKRKNEAGMLDAKLELEQQKQRNAAALNIQRIEEEERQEKIRGVANAEREAEIAIKNAEKDAKVAQLGVEMEAKRRQTEIDAEARLQRSTVEAEQARATLKNTAEVERATIKAEADARLATIEREKRMADFEQEQKERELRLELEARETAVQHEKRMREAEYESAMAKACPQRELAKVVEAVGNAIDTSGVTVTGNMSVDQLNETLQKMTGIPMGLAEILRTRALEPVVDGMRAVTSVGIARPGPDARAGFTGLGPYEDE